MYAIRSYYVTGQYLSRTKKIETPAKRRKGNGKKITIKGAKTNNLKNVDVSFPLGTLTCVTGVSGGGKSSRITSYNVCYTKLLRIALSLK